MTVALNLGDGSSGPIGRFHLDSLAKRTARVHPHCVEASEMIQCPFCGEAFELVIDTSVPSQCFTTDCEICCRPFEVLVKSELGEILSLDVRGN